MKMRLIAATVASMLFSTVIVASDSNGEASSLKATPNTLTTEVDKLSYSIGADLGKNFKKQGIDINPSTLAKGMQDSIENKQLLLSEQQMQETLNKFQKDLMAKRNAEFTKKSEENKTKGETFLTQNKTKEGVVSLPSGLQYKIIKSGNGAKPAKNDTVTVEYTGSLIDGQVFDSTEKTGKPATFKVSQVIPGWTEALQLMPAGSTWEIYVPSTLAYGSRSIGGAIGPNETLIFKIHLLEVKKSDA